MDSSSDTLTRLLRYGALGSTLLLVYASLVPLNYTPLPWDTTVEQWRNIPWLELGVFRRADWVANALVVMPPAFLATGWLDLRNSSRRALLSALPLLIAFFASLVLAIELVQVWFPPRTVSQNDIVAGWIGSLLGVVGWLVIGPRLVAYIQKFCDLESIEQRIQWLCVAAMAACVLYTIFPLDLVLSHDEFLRKLDSGRLEWGLPLNSLTSIEGLKGIILSAFRTIPLGLWLALRGYRRPPLPSIVVVALSLELIQLPIFSKYTSTWEVVAGIGGAILGFAVVRWVRRWRRVFYQSEVWTGAILLWSAGILVAFLWRDFELIRSRELIAEGWSEFLTAPLLRYYYTSEYAALSNILGKLGMFAVLGGLFAGRGWAKFENAVSESVRAVRGSPDPVERAGGAGSRDPRPAWTRFWLGLAAVVLLGFTIEVAQVYLAPVVADCSDVGIYAVGYVSGYFGAHLLMVGCGGETNCAGAESSRTAGK